MTQTSRQTLGRYEIVEEIGKGSTGVVYLAHDPLIGRTVALKTIRLDIGNGESEVEPVRDEFLQEARSAGILSHPNIVTIHDVVAEDGSLPFIAMEYVQGSNLEELIRAGQALPLDFVVDTVTQIASGLDYAHAKGVIHRDIKPANILINQEEKVKITDFGIAQFFSTESSGDEKVMGTPSYVSPEQIIRMPTDHRSDIYSFGVVAYEMITGHLPFKGKDVTDLAKQIAYEPHTPPTDYLKTLPTLVANVLDKALHKHPEFRHQSAGELAEDLRAAVEASTPAESGAHKRTEDLSRPVAAVPVEDTPPLPAKSEPPSEREAPAGPQSVAPLGSGTTPAPVQGRSWKTVAAQLLNRFRKDDSASVSASEVKNAAPQRAAARDDLATQDIALQMLEPETSRNQGSQPASPLREPAAIASQSAAHEPARALLAYLRSASTKRLLLIAAATALIFGSTAFLALRLLTSSEPIDTGASISHQRRLKFMELVQDGRAHLRAGDPDAAARSFELAKQAAPAQLAGGSGWLLQAQREVDDLQEYETLEQETLALLRDGFQLMEQREYQQAKDLASTILAMNPQRIEALTLLEQADGVLRSLATAAQTPRAPRATPTVTLLPPTATQPHGENDPAVVVPTSLYTDLVIDFFSQKSKGVLTIYADEKQILREQFRYMRRAGFLRRRREVSGGFEKIRRLDTKKVALVIYLSGPDRDTQRADLGLDATDGIPRLLRIRVDSEGVLTTQVLNARKGDSQ